MKKLTFLTMGLVLASSMVFGQFVNGDLETWTSSGGYDTPTGWTTSNAALGTTAIAVTKSSDNHNGTSAAKLQGVQGFVPFPGFPSGVPVTVPGVITTGAFNGTALTGGQPYTTKSTNFKGYYKYMPSGSDSALIEVSFFKSNGSGGRDRVAYGRFAAGSTANYTAFDIKMVYDAAFTSAPDSQLVTIASSKNITSATIGSVLYVDHMEFSGILTGVSEEVKGAVSSAYPNPASNDLTISTDINADVVAIFDITGRKMAEVTVNNQAAYFNTNTYTKGIYYYAVYNKNNEIASKGKVAIVK